MNAITNLRKNKKIAGYAFALIVSLCCLYFLMLLPAALVYKYLSQSDLARIAAALPGFIFIWVKVAPWLEKEFGVGLKNER